MAKSKLPSQRGLFELYENDPEAADASVFFGSQTTSAAAS
jgi:hypothetical protein